MSTGFFTQADQQAFSQSAADPYSDYAEGPPAFNLDGYDSEGIEPSQGGGLIEVEGAYHLEIADAKVDDAPNRNNRPQITVRLVVLQSVEGQSPAGSAMWHHIELPTPDDKTNTTSKGVPWWTVVMQATCEFLAGVGLFAKVKGPDGKEKFIDLATNSTKLQFATVAQRLKGLQVIGRPKRREFEKKDGSKGFTMEFPYGRGCSKLGAPENAHIPINVEAAAAVGFTRQPLQKPAPATATASAPQAKQPTAPARQQTLVAPPQAPTSAGEYADL